jgi:hypothetical protein
MFIKEISPNNLNVKVLMILIGKNKLDYIGEHNKIPVLLVLQIGIKVIVINF